MAIFCFAKYDLLFVVQVAALVVAPLLQAFGRRQKADLHSSTSKTCPDTCPKLYDPHHKL